MAPVGDDARSERVARDSAALRLEIVARPQRARRRGRVVAVRLRPTTAPRVRVGDFGLWNESESYWTRRARLGPRAFGGQNASRREFGTPHRNRGFSGERGRRVPAARVPVGRGQISAPTSPAISYSSGPPSTPRRTRDGRWTGSSVWGRFPHHAANASVVREPARGHDATRRLIERVLSVPARRSARRLWRSARARTPPRVPPGRVAGAVGVRARRRAARRAGVRQGARLGGVHGRERLRRFSEASRRAAGTCTRGGWGAVASARFDFAPTARAPTSIDAPINLLRPTRIGCACW